MAFNDLDRIYCFSLGDFHNFEKCYFNFLAKHHLQKRYELEEGNKNQAIGNILDLVMKIIHREKVYHQPLDYILNSIFKAAENEMRDKVERAGPKSFYGATIPFLTEENISHAKEVFQRYYLAREGKINKAVLNDKFWECILEGEKGPVDLSSQMFKIWGGPDALEMGEDGTPEIVDYKFREEQNNTSNSNNYDLDLAPKLYTLLCAQELIKLGYKKVRFRIRLWHNPLEESLYEEFDLQIVANLRDFFHLKIEKILSITELSFCEKPFCKACNCPQRQDWIKQLKLKNYIRI